eukprot:GHVN01060960.1.p1 GENE.GHVN01060960.1~~GHVN01060960.1.p1  ORF type:complete len:330 (-),score=60.31 GHVN01060960.1:181-1170(-)
MTFHHLNDQAEYSIALVTLETLFDWVPTQMLEFFEEVDQYKFQDKPNYDRLRDILDQMATHHPPKSSDSPCHSPLTSTLHAELYDFEFDQSALRYVQRNVVGVERACTEKDREHKAVVKSTGVLLESMKTKRFRHHLASSLSDLPAELPLVNASMECGSVQIYPHLTRMFAFALRCGLGGQGGGHLLPINSIDGKPICFNSLSQQMCSHPLCKKLTHPMGLPHLSPDSIPRGGVCLVYALTGICPGGCSLHHWNEAEVREFIATNCLPPRCNHRGNSVPHSLLIHPCVRDEMSKRLRREQLKEAPCDVTDTAEALTCEMGRSERDELIN